MQPKLKSALTTSGLIVFLLLIVVSLMVTFVSGPLEKQRRERVSAFQRVKAEYQITAPVYLNTSSYDRVCLIGEGTFEGIRIYFSSDPLGRVLDHIAQDQVDLNQALAFASKSATFEKPLVRLAYFKGKFVVAIIEQKRETLLDISTYSVVLTVETGV